MLLLLEKDEGAKKSVGRCVTCTARPVLPKMAVVKCPLQICSHSRLIYSQLANSQMTLQVCNLLIFTFFLLTSLRSWYGIMPIRRTQQNQSFSNISNSLPEWMKIMHQHKCKVLINVSTINKLHFPNFARQIRCMWLFFNIFLYQKRLEQLDFQKGEKSYFESKQEEAFARDFTRDMNCARVIS